MSKIEKITKQLQHEQADAAWITTPLNVFYFTGYRSEPHETICTINYSKWRSNLILSKDGS